MTGRQGSSQTTLQKAILHSSFFSNVHRILTPAAPVLSWFESLSCHACSCTEWSSLFDSRSLSLTCHESPPFIRILSITLCAFYEVWWSWTHLPMSYVVLSLWEIMQIEESGLFIRILIITLCSLYEVWWSWTFEWCAIVQRMNRLKS